VWSSQSESSISQYIFLLNYSNIESLPSIDLWSFPMLIVTSCFAPWRANMSVKRQGYIVGTHALYQFSPVLFDSFIVINLFAASFRPPGTILKCNSPTSSVAILLFIGVFRFGLSERAVSWFCLLPWFWDPRFFPLALCLCRSDPKSAHWIGSCIHRSTNSRLQWKCNTHMAPVPEAAL